MSRIGKMPIAVPAGVEVTVAEGNLVTVKGPKGTLTQQLQPSMTIKQEGAELLVSRPDDGKENRALHGLTRALLHNMVVGVTDGYKKTLEVNGVGYRAAKEGNKLVLNIGYSHTTRSSFPAATSRRSVSLPLRSAKSVLPSRTRARASSMLTKSFAARSVRPALRSKEVCRYD